MSMPSERDDVTLFRGAADNSYFEVYFNALPVHGAEAVSHEVVEVDLRPDREMTLHVEIYNPDASIPLRSRSGPSRWRSRKLRICTC